MRPWGKTPEEARMEVAVIGAGSWGTALARVLADKGHAVTLWGRSPDLLAEIAARGENTRYLPGCRLPETLRTEPDLARATADKEFVVSVVPSHTVREVFLRAAEAISKDAIVIS